MELNRDDSPVEPEMSRLADNEAQGAWHLTLSDFARRVERLVAGPLCAGVVLGTIGRWLGRWHWVFEITTHFVVQATVVAGAATLWLWIRRYRKPALICACLTLVNASEWVPYYVPVSSRSGTAPPESSLVVASVNVYSRNRNSKALLDWLTENHVDVVFISEVDPWWSEQIKSWQSDWPYQEIRPRSDNFGLAIISRLPIARTEISLLTGDVPAVECQIQTPAGTWSFVGLHPLPPMGAKYSRLRNMQLQDAAKLIQQSPSPRVVLGDLNSSSSSPFFRDLLTATGLKDSRQGFGWQPTWPAGNRVLRIPIDHCLVDPAVRVVSREVGPDIGSDHLPVLCRLKRGP